MAIRFIDEKGEEHYIELGRATFKDPGWKFSSEYPGLVVRSPEDDKLVMSEPMRVLKFRDRYGDIFACQLTSCGDDEYHYNLDGRCWHTRQYSERMAELGISLVEICPCPGD